MKATLPQWDVNKTYYNVTVINYTNHRGVSKKLYEVINRVAVNKFGIYYVSESLKGFIYYENDLVIHND